MREFLTLMLPLAGILALLFYLFLVNPDSLVDFGRWLQTFF
jgi:hypothetical protein